MHRYQPDKHHRRTIRLSGHDYAKPGLYFITICCQNRLYLFGKIAQCEPETGQPETWQPQGIAPTEIILNDAGKMVETEWLALPDRFSNIQLYEYIIMPDHLHAILEIVVPGIVTPVGPVPPVGATLVVAQSEPETGQPQGIAPTIFPISEPETGQPQGIAPTGKTVGDIMDAFKSITTVKYIRGVKNFGWQPFDRKLWQRNYYEHIIRNEESHQHIANYIVNNHAQWQEDKLHATNGLGNY